MTDKTDRGQLTAADKDALRLLPREWFGVNAVHYMVRRPCWRCDRLVAFGFLEARVIGSYPSFIKEYRKVAAPPKGTP